jgi:hypothetical protein
MPWMNWAMLRRFRFRLSAAPAIVLTPIWTAVAYQLKSAHDKALACAREHAENITGVVAA